MPDTPSPDEIRALAFPLLCALEDSVLKERTRRVCAWVVRLSYGFGFQSIRLERQEDLGTLSNVGKTHVRDAIADARKHKILQDFPEDDALLEINPNFGEWQVSTRCVLGPVGAGALALEIAAREGQRREGRDFGEIETTFQRDPIALAISEQSIEDALAQQRGSSSSAATGQQPFHRPPAPGAASGRLHENPPGISGAEKGGVGTRTQRLSQMFRRSLSSHGENAGSGGKVTPEGTFQSAPTQSEGRDGPKVTPEVTFGGNSAVAGAEKLPRRELSSRARASDDSSSSDHHLPQKEIYLSSSSSEDDPGKDEGGAAGKWQMVPMSDWLLGDVRRALDGDMGSFTWYWRLAIWGARGCVAEALASLKVKIPPAYQPGGYLRMCFLREARARRIALPAELVGRGSGKGAGR